MIMKVLRKLKYEASENIFLFAFIPLFVSFGMCIYVKDIFDTARKL